MEVDYLGINLGTLEYIAILLFGLTIFVVIWIIAEKKRQIRHNQRIRKLKKNAELRILG